MNGDMIQVGVLIGWVIGIMVQLDLDYPIIPRAIAFKKRRNKC